MYNTKIFLNKQYDFMQKLFLKEQEKVRKEREMQQKQSQGQTKTGGLFGGLFSNFKIGLQKQQTPKPIAEKPEEKKQDHYLMQTTTEDQKPSESTDLIDFGDDVEDHHKPDAPQLPQEKEVPMVIDEKDTQDDEETKRSETDTAFEDRTDYATETPKVATRGRSDSISSSSTTKLYSYTDLSDFVNIDELQKFLYKCGAMLVNQNGKMEEWIEWMQKTLAEYYVYTQVLYKQAKDVEILKDFLSKKLQVTKYKLDLVTNEKEDLIAQQEAETGIKELLAKQMQDLNMRHIEKTHELVMVKQKLAEAKEDIVTKEGN
jgi:hypothetical protein